jgi:hypothetical protein
MSPTDDATARKQIDEILSSFSDDKRAVLQTLRETIAAAAPDAVEGISYGLRHSAIEAGRSCPTTHRRATVRSSR